MAGFFQGTDPDIDPNNAEASAKLAEDWAIKIDGPVSGSDYSSLYNAGLSENSAVASQKSADTAAQAAVDAAASADSLDALLLGDLVDVSATAPTIGDVLTWNGSMWEPGTAVVVASTAVNDLIERMISLECKLREKGLI